MNQDITCVKRDCESVNKQNLHLLETSRQLLKTQDSEVNRKLENQNTLKEMVDKASMLDADCSCVDRENKSFKDSNNRLTTQCNNQKDESCALKKYV